MQYSKQFITTLREVPSDAQAVSHILALRASLVRQNAQGTFSVLPLGKRVFTKVSDLIQNKMENIDGLEISIPNCEDSTAIYCDLAKAYIKSYKNLPLTLYSTQSISKSKQRVYGGLIGAKESYVHESVCFSSDSETLDGKHLELIKIYKELFDRFGITYIETCDTKRCLDAREYFVPSSAGEDTAVCCTACDYASDISWAEIKCSTCETEPKELEKIHTPTQHTIGELCEFLGCEPSKVAKTLIYVANGKPIAVMIRGDRTLNEERLKGLLGCKSLELAPSDVVTAVTHAEVGFAGPVGLDVPVYADSMLKNAQNLIVGANESEYHLKNVCVSRDYTVTQYADLVDVEDGDLCPHCGAPMKLQKGFVIAQFLKLGEEYPNAYDCKFLSADGTPKTTQMLVNRVDISRVVAAMLEKSHDDDGIIWNKEVTPYQVLIISIGKPDSEEWKVAQTLHDTLTQHGFDVLLDDRNERAGVKFKDADLIGIPLRITAGKKACDGICELKFRDAHEVSEITVEDAIKKTLEYYR